MVKITGSAGVKRPREFTRLPYLKGLRDVRRAASAGSPVRRATGTDEASPWGALPPSLRDGLALAHAHVRKYGLSQPYWQGHVAAAQRLSMAEDWVAAIGVQSAMLVNFGHFMNNGATLFYAFKYGHNGLFDEYLTLPDLFSSLETFSGVVRSFEGARALFVAAVDSQKTYTLPFMLELFSATGVVMNDSELLSRWSPDFEDALSIASSRDVVLGVPDMVHVSLPVTLDDYGATAETLRRYYGRQHALGVDVGALLEAAAVSLEDGRSLYVAMRHLTDMAEDQAAPSVVAWNRHVAPAMLHWLERYE